MLNLWRLVALSHDVRLLFDAHLGGVVGLAMQCAPTSLRPFGHPGGLGLVDALPAHRVHTWRCPANLSRNQLGPSGLTVLVMVITWVGPNLGWAHALPGDPSHVVVEGPNSFHP